MQIEMVEIDKLQGASYNPRKMPEKEMRKLKRSIQEFGWAEPIVVNKMAGREGIIVGGHQRWQAAKELGLKEVPVVYVELTEDKEKSLNVALNRISGEWQEDKLTELLISLDQENKDLTLTGLDDREIDRLLSDFREGKEEEPTPDKIQSRVQIGDIWELPTEWGNHRVMCCDNTVKENYQKLIGDKIVDLVLTDPHYNLGYTYHSFQDNSTPEEYEITCRKWFGILKEYSDKILITCGPQNTAMWCKIEKPKWIIAWFKRNANSGCALRGLNKWEPIILYGKFEPVLFFGKVDKIIPWDVIEAEFNKTDDVYDVRTAFIEDTGEAIAGMHSCPKPTKLFSRLIKDFTRLRNITLDIFLGSGTCIIASEKIKRVCYGMELDPYYMDLAITRWEQYSNKQAKLVFRNGKDVE